MQIMNNAPKEFIKLPVLVEAWKVNADELPQIAKWCGGKVRGLSITFPKVRDRSKVLNPDDRNSYAVVGDYIYRVSKGFALMKGEDFERQHREHTQRS